MADTDFASLGRFGRVYVGPGTRPVPPAPPERKYALTRLGPGDYLLPGNDARTIWRIAKYTDGPSGGLEIAHHREFWGVWRWLHHVDPHVDHIDPDDWSLWSMEGSSHETRRDAINDALRMTPDASP